MDAVLKSLGFSYGKLKTSIGLDLCCLKPRVLVNATYIAFEVMGPEGYLVETPFGFASGRGFHH